MKSETIKMTIYEMVVCALMTALICIFAPMSIPIGLVPISLTNLVLYFMIYILGTRGTLISYLIYMLIGLCGLPVFSNYTGGPGKIAGPTGGYLIGFFLMILISGLCFDLTHRPKFEAGIRKLGKTEASKTTILRIFQIAVTVLGMIVGTAIAYAFGTAWFVIQQKCDIAHALTVCVYPFIPFDLAKIAAATVVGYSVRFALVKARLLPKI